jgi:hypothetical protein
MAPAEQSQDLILDMDDARCYNSQQTTAKIEKLRLSRISDPPDSPDISLSHFWFCVFLNEKRQDIQYDKSKQLLDPVLATLATVPESIVLPYMKIELKG